MAKPVSTPRIGVHTLSDRPSLAVTQSDGKTGALFVAGLLAPVGTYDHSCIIYSVLKLMGRDPGISVIHDNGQTRTDAASGRPPVL